MSEPLVNPERLLGRLEQFARIGATAGGGVNRQALSPEDRDARALLARLGAQRGFAVFQDPIANLFLRREGRNRELPPLMIGSHLDSQPTGGRYDGALGTLAALEVLEALEDAGAVTDRAVELVAWTNEEGSRFAPGTMGSIAFRERRIGDALLSQFDADGSSLETELTATLAALSQAAPRPLGGALAGYLELHIEQGTILEAGNFQVGVVDKVQGTRWLEVIFRGQVAHAGTTEFTSRRDPMTAAAGALSDLFAGVMPEDKQARFTVGRIAAKPGSINAIPGEVSLVIDLRHPEVASLDSLEDQIRNACREWATANGCTATVAKTLDMAPASFSSVMVDMLDRSANRLGLSSRRMISGAFHDALQIASVAPTAMIFVPCRDGLSHNEAEYVEPAHAVSGTRLLLEATLAAAREG